MHILAIETTGAHCSVALINEKNDIHYLSSDQKMNHLKTLTPMISELVKTAKISLLDIDAIAVSEGPGSFTGIRIGVSTARALGQVLDKKLINIPSLQAFSYSKVDHDGIVCPLLDARQHQVYSAAYCDWECIIKGGAYDLNDFLAKLKMAILDRQDLEKTNFDGEKDVLFIGDGISVYMDLIVEWASENSINVVFDEKSSQTAISVAKLAKDYYERNMIIDFSESKPNYMRQAEAQRRLEE